jgi:ribosomal protein L37AE/L43A
MAKRSNIGGKSQDSSKGCPECEARMHRVILVCGKTKVVWKCEACGYFDNSLRKIDIDALLKQTYPTLYKNIQR